MHTLFPKHTAPSCRRQKTAYTCRFSRLGSRPLNTTSPHQQKFSFIDSQTKYSKPFPLWRKIQFLIYLPLFSSIFLSCTQNLQIPPSSPQTLDQTIENLLDDQASCALPESAQIIHLPQVHHFPYPLRDTMPKKVLDFLQNIATHSQFLITHIISQNDSYIVFNEGSRFVVTENTKENITYPILSENGNRTDLSFQDIAGIFNQHLPLSFENLNNEQKHLLLELGAAPIALSLGHIKTIHRTHNPSEARSLGQILIKMWDTEKDLQSEAHDLYERIQEAEDNNDEKQLESLQKKVVKLSERRMALSEESNQIIMDKRENILAREVNFFLQNNPSKKVFIIYGAAHDLSDEFRDDQFYTLPHRCTMPDSFLQSHSYAGFLKDWADRIYHRDVLYPSHIQSMKTLYQKSYSILINLVEDHVQNGGSKEDSSLSWSSSNRYLTYAELEFIAETIYIQMLALEDMIQLSRDITNSSAK